MSLHNFAVGDPSLTRLYLGRNNCGEASFYDIGEQTTDTVEVETRAPSVLPKAQIVKIDTEGSEVDILARMASLDFDAIMLEYHSEANRRKIDALLQDFVLAGGHIRHPNRGTLKFCAQAPNRGHAQVVALTWQIPTRTCLEDCPWPLSRPARGCSSVG